jgi:DNA end-binding protein Ku
MASHVIWKGAISFGLVHVPVALYPASTEGGIDFDWLDKRSMDPVGYKRINKRTGREIASADIVKGVKLDDGDYVVLSDDEIRRAFPKTTQTIAIESFVNATEIPFVMLERPYYLEPVAKGAKVYALLREAMLQEGVIGIARVVMHTKEHLAALIPAGPALMLNTLRWQSEIRDWSELDLPAAGKSAEGLKDSDLEMAARLVADMTKPWRPEHYGDNFSDAIHTLVKQRAHAGKTETVQPLEADTEPASASNVVDLSELLRKSLSGHGPRAVKANAAKKTAPRKRA